MNHMTRILLSVLLLSLVACHTTGVEIGESELQSVLGKTEAELRETFGVPHTHGTDSEGVVTLGYGLQHHRLFRIDETERVEFELVNDRVVRWRRVGSRPIANKNRAY